MTERMVTSETGGRKGKKDAQLGTIDPKALLVLAEVGGKGAEKYARHNYLKGYDWSLSFDALQRHSLAFWAGEDTDPESGLPHMAHAAFHALALVSFLTRDLGTDDRFKQDHGVTVEEATPQQWAEIVAQHPWLKPEVSESVPPPRRCLSCSHDRGLHGKEEGCQALRPQGRRYTLCGCPLTP